MGVASLVQQQQHILDLRRDRKQAKDAKIAALEQLKDEVRPHRSDISDESRLGVLQIEDLAESDHSKDSFEDHHSSSGQDSADSEASSEYGELKESLISDYSICLERLEAMQTTIEGALRKLNTLSTKRSIVKPKLIREVDKNGRQTLLCLKAHITKSVSHRRIMRKGNLKSPCRSAETTNSSPLLLDEVARSMAGKL